MRAMQALHPLAGLEPREEDELQRALKSYRDELLAREPGVRLGADPEELHKQRVATRRLRSLLRSARPVLEDPIRTERLRDELRWLGALLGEVRDRDVLIDYLVAELATLEEAAAFGAVLELLDGERDEARERLIGALDGPRYATLLAELERLPGLKEGASLERVAADDYRRLRRAARRLDAKATDEELHRLRIRAKRARYAAEAVGAKKEFVDRAKDLQDVLGEHQDAVVAEERIRDLLARVRGTGRTALAAGRLIERQRLRRANARRAWPKAWKRLERAGDAEWR
ncbi:MAG TPA: CHAD domain-containing protein [Gaiellaceae bacterium]|jgi:CHAD domain-containing protein|nr:CHAD domain-containing protein [Gaiellaceae bacterium]